jgi:hypothetical protein
MALSSAVEQTADPRRLAGTAKQCSLNFGRPCHGKVMKMLEMVSRTIVRIDTGM